MVLLEQGDSWRVGKVMYPSLAAETAPGFKQLHTSLP